MFKDFLKGLSTVIGLIFSIAFTIWCFTLGFFILKIVSSILIVFFGFVIIGRISRYAKSKNKSSKSIIVIFFILLIFTFITTKSCIDKNQNTPLGRWQFDTMYVEIKGKNSGGDIEIFDEPSNKTFVGKWEQIDGTRLLINYDDGSSSTGFIDDKILTINGIGKFYRY
jgi:energy-coupling factor transporter transmembrane protein EcfT